MTRDEILYIKEKDLYDAQKSGDIRTDFGKGMYYITASGHRVATPEELMAYNAAFYASMIKRNDMNKYKLIEISEPKSR